MNLIFFMPFIYAIPLLFLFLHGCASTPCDICLRHKADQSPANQQPRGIWMPAAAPFVACWLIPSTFLSFSSSSFSPVHIQDSTCPLLLSIAVASRPPGRICNAGDLILPISISISELSLTVRLNQARPSLRPKLSFC